MASLDDAVEITVHPDANSSAIFKLYAEKIDYPPFSRSEIAQMSNEEYLKYEPLIMEQLKNGDFKEQKPDYSKYTNPLTGNKKIYTKEELAKMTPDEFMEKEGEIIGQLQSIGLPQKSDLPNATNGEGRWVTIDGNHVFIEK